MTDTIFTVWFTGVPSSGKSTTAALLCRSLQHMGLHAELLDSGKIRRELNPDLGFSKEDVRRSMNRLAYECQMLNRNNVVAIVAAVSPYREFRKEVRARLGSFVEVFCDAPVETLIKRNPDSLLARARRGEVTNVAGVDVPYEPPDSPEVHLNTASMSAQDCLRRILKTLELLKYIPHEESGYTAREEEMIKQRLQDLGYI